MRRVPGALLLVVLLISFSTLAAQTPRQMQPTVPSPTAASLGKFGDIPISYFNGLPQISIPLFTARGKTLGLPISLDYHASGIKVEEIGGWVGMGWALEAGGVITRTVRGIVDEQYEGYFNTGHTFYEPANWAFPPPVTLVQNIHDMQSVDGEPDQFFFNFAGQTGEFVGGDTSRIESTPNVYVTIPYRKWRLEPQFGNDPVYGMRIISRWVITTEDGMKYTFGAFEIHVDRNHQWRGDGGSYPQPYASSWYLTEIRAPGGDVITLQYADYVAEHHTGMYREESNDTYEVPLLACALPGERVGGSTIFDLHNQSYIHAKRLTTITSAAHTITFTHSLRDDARSPYYDDPGAPYGASITGRQQQEPKLDTMIIKTPAPENAILRRVLFEYDYSLGGRLTLLRVTELDGNTPPNRLPPYSFTYDGPTLPARVTDRTDYHDSPTRTASFALDAWGYYNGADTNSTLIPPGTSDFATHNSYPGSNREPNFAYMKAGSLIKIVYPTGGFNEFVYEPNDYSSGASLVQNQPVPHNAGVVSSPGDVAVATKDFTVGGLDPTVKATIDVYISDSTCAGYCYVELWTGGGMINRWTVNRTAYGIQDLSRGTTYTLKAWNLQRPNVRVAASVQWQEKIALTKKLAGGLRIREVRANDGMGNVTVRKYTYELSDGKSSGWITLGPRFQHNREMISSDLMKQCSYFSRASAPKNALGSGLQVGYSVVTESLGVNGVFGIVRRYFDAGCDCDTAVRAANYNRDWPFLRYTSDAWRRGELLSTEELSASGAIQRITSNTYGNPPSSHPTIRFRGLAVDVYSMVSHWTNGWPATTYFIWAWQFEVQTALKVQTGQVITVYDTTGANGFGTTQTFTYGNPNHSQLTDITETNSDGTLRITRMKYPADYASGGPPGTEAGALGAMQDVSPTGAHMPGVVIERAVSTRSGGSERIVQADITTFKEFLTGQFLPYKHYVLNSPTPIP